MTMKAIVTTYHGPTNTRGSRIIAKAEGGHRVSVPYSHELSGDAVYAIAARKLCDKLGWKGELISGGLPNGDVVFVFADNSERF
jgi:hypothetical protein